MTATPTCPDQDPDCMAQGCPEHQACSYGDHTYEQHHSPKDHVSRVTGEPAPEECRCDVYIRPEITGGARVYVLTRRATGTVTYRMGGTVWVTFPWQHEQVEQVGLDDVEALAPEGYRRQVHRSCGDPTCNDLDHLEVREAQR